GQGVATLLAATALLRFTEAVLASRHALKGGAAADDVVRAIAGETRSEAQVATHAVDTRKRIAHGVSAGLGVFLALSEGTMSSSNVALPDAISSFLQVALTIVPPFLIGRGLHGVIADSALSAFARRRITTPIGRSIVRLFGGTPAPQAEN